MQDQLYGFRHELSQESSNVADKALGIAWRPQHRRDKDPVRSVQNHDRAVSFVPLGDNRLPTVVHADMPVY